MKLDAYHAWVATGWSWTLVCDGSGSACRAVRAAHRTIPRILTIKWVIEEGPLGFLADAFEVELCQGGMRRFTELSRQELLNLKPSTILDLPSKLGRDFSVSSSFLQEALNPYLIQTAGKSVLEEKYGLKPGKFLISATKHYSWPKGGAISGIGSVNFIDVDVDEEARMDMTDLRKRTRECVEDEIPIYGVVAIIGSTEHGACDPVEEIVKIRQEYEREGISFAIHCDAAWGGYFAATIRERKDRDELLPYVPAMPLQPYTVRQLENLCHADSITIDPHKSGYINYPAGGLCYRDGRMRYLVTWTSPIVFHEGDAVESMGVYGVEGSKPGAAAAAAWLTHKTLGLHKEGYGRLLGEAVFSCIKLYCHWATMAPLSRPQFGGGEGRKDAGTLEESPLIVVPLIRLPAEKAGEPQDVIEARRERIRTDILQRTNQQLFEDAEAWRFMCELAGDLMINAFACNFKLDGVVNQDVGEANYLNQWIFSQLSVASENDPTRLGLDDGGATSTRGDLRFLVNVTMSPWPTSPDFMTRLVRSFRDVALKGVERCIKRNRLGPDTHGFVMQGLKEVYLVHIPMFNMANHRWQLIITADFPPNVLERYRQLRSENPGVVYTVANMQKEILEDLVRPGSIAKWRLDEGIPGPNSPAIIDDFELTNIRVVIRESMSYADLETAYPDRMPFYLYGNKQEKHLDHVLKASPNAQISHESVALDLKMDLSDEQLKKGVVAVLEDVYENSLQPLPLNQQGNSVDLGAAGLSLTPGATHGVSIYETYEQDKNGSASISRVRVTIGETTFADWADVNMDPNDHN
ncbi:putative L-tyrosine decarboxylase [Triangularia verruculosa]|uniref:L-tyrosine decarboxylase n=1 Tax=Triangularia verruculosa TaxID=2587418 RepID=A0AAN7AT96_9PEZI|nr:putative L-tyrosine decarboxylase [Triangularia verruculosa]